jgi:[acyl-carrier-protein] S-malonyltransferase
VANDNAPGQVVVGGAPEDVTWVIGQARRARRLAVSGAFHTPFMASAADALGATIDAIPIGDAAHPVVSNVDAIPRSAGLDLAGGLKAQLTGRVRFRESVGRMADEGVDTFHCIGPGDAVAGMVRRIAPDAEVKGVP